MTLSAAVPALSPSTGVGDASYRINSAEGSEGMVRVTVVDTGAGIPPEDLPYIFERFWRGERSRSRAGGGAGLGLAIAKHLVQAHGGEMGVGGWKLEVGSWRKGFILSKGLKTGEVGQGATFYFTLPLSPPT